MNFFRTSQLYNPHVINLQFFAKDTPNGENLNLCEKESKEYLRNVKIKSKIHNIKYNGNERKIRANLRYEFRWRGRISFFSSPPLRFRPKAGAILYTVQWDTFPRPLQISECRQPCDLFSVHSSRLLAAPQQAQGPFQSCWLVGFRLDAVSLYRFILRHFASLSLPLCPTTSSSTSPLSLLLPLSLPFLGVPPPPV